MTWQLCYFNYVIDNFRDRYKRTDYKRHGRRRHKRRERKSCMRRTVIGQKNNNVICLSLSSLICSLSVSLLLTQASSSLFWADYLTIPPTNKFCIYKTSGGILCLTSFPWSSYCGHINIQTYMHIYTHVYIYTNTNTHLYIYIYIYIYIVQVYRIEYSINKFII